MPAIAVLVVTWNSAKVIDGLLASLRPGLAGLDWHLVVADNDSADDTAARVQRWANENPELRCQVVNTGGNLGYAAGINAALAASGTAQSGTAQSGNGQPGKFDAALVLNPDIRLHSGAVAAMYEFIDSAAPAGDGAGPRTGIVVPRIVDEEGNLAHSLRREPTLLRALGEATLGARAGRFAPLGELVMDESAYQRPAVADWATGAIMLISAACLDACGSWDESFFLYSEETEFALRARDRGFLTRLAPKATAMHIGGESKVSPELWTLLMSNRVKLYRRRHALPAAVAYWGAALLREAPRAALGQQRSRSAVKALLNKKVLSG